LIKALDDEDCVVRRIAAEALRKLGDTRAVEPLIKALNDNDEDGRVRFVAAEALVKLLRDPCGVEPLIHALEGRNSSVRFVAAEALGKLGDARAVEPLARVLDDEDGDVCLVAAEALAKLVHDPRAIEPLINDPRAIEPLIKAMGNRAGVVRWGAADALACLGEVKWKPLIRGDLEDFVRLAASGDARAVEPLIRALGHGDYDVCRAAAHALGQLGDARAIEPLIKALWDNHSGACFAAAEALARLGEVKWTSLIRGDRGDFFRLAASGEPRFVEPLIGALRHGDDAYAREAAKALGKLRDPRAVEPLIEALGYSQPRGGTRGVREAAAEALKSLLTGASPLAISLSRWQHIRTLVRTCHTDAMRGDIMNGKATIHGDEGIGLDFPAEPPAGMTRQTAPLPKSAPPSAAVSRAGITPNMAPLPAQTADRTIALACPNCGKALKAPKHLGGSTGCCPACKTKFQIPAQSDTKGNVKRDF
jgi:HEAT repeat protein